AHRERGMPIAIENKSDRRRFLTALAGATAACTLGPLATAARASTPAGLTAEPLGDRTTLIGGAGGNVLALSGNDGLLLVDCGAAEHGRDLLKVLGSLPGGRTVRTVFNTHWHWDHTGNNELLRKGGADIIAHENTRLWLGTE